MDDVDDVGHVLVGVGELLVDRAAAGGDDVDSDVGKFADDARSGLAVDGSDKGLLARIEEFRHAS